MALEKPGAGQPPAQEPVKFEDVHIEPWPDGRRIRVHISLTPFERRPNLEAALFTQSGEEISRLHIIEALENKMVFTMHLRGVELPGNFILHTLVYYDPESVLDERKILFSIEEADTEQ